MSIQLGSLVRTDANGAAANPLRAGLDSSRITDPCSIVFFGASGDLMTRMLLPAMYNLRLGDVLQICAVAFVLACVSTIYPAWRAARLAPAESLRND